MAKVKIKNGRIKKKKKGKAMRWHAVANVINRRLVVGAEIGVDRGAMSRELFRRIPGLKLYMVDIWSEDAYPDKDHTSASVSGQKRYKTEWKSNFNAAKKAVHGQNAIIIRGDSVASADKVQDGELDFCFIDGDHSYNGCKRDIEAWLPKVKDGGWICGHDYERKEPRKFGVRKAVDEAFGDRVKTGAGQTWFVKVTA